MGHLAHYESLSQHLPRPQIHSPDARNGPRNGPSEGPKQGISGVPRVQIPGSEGPDLEI